jgi:hypothetical protein
VRDIEKEISVTNNETWKQIDKIQAKLKETPEVAVTFASLKSLERVFQRFQGDPQFRSESEGSVVLTYDVKFQPREFTEEDDDKERKKKAKTEKEVGPRDTLPEQQVYSHYQLMINDYYR